MRSSWRPSRPALVVVMALALLAVDALWVEPYRLEVTRHRVPAAVRAPVLLAHLTDLHSGGLGRRERNLVSVLRAERPDLVVVTGDSVPDHETGQWPEPVAEVFREIEAPLGVWVVLGNWEHWRNVATDSKFYRAAGVNLLVNESHRVRDDLWLVGLDDSLSGAPDIDAAFAQVPEGASCVALMHSPDLFPRLPPRPLLGLAGHTHGGQVRIPGFGPLWLPRGTGPYEAGWYSHGPSRLYISRGVGMSILPVRFWCRPELALITLVPEHPGLGHR